MENLALGVIAMGLIIYLFSFVRPPKILNGVKAAGRRRGRRRFPLIQDANGSTRSTIFQFEILWHDPSLRFVILQPHRCPTYQL
jgi:hypothetical protein